MPHPLLLVNCYGYTNSSTNPIICMTRTKACICCLLFILTYSCKTPFQPTISSTATNYLVVDGVINTSNATTDSTIIKLSRTSKLSAANKPAPELHAVVSVEDGQGFSFTLHEMGKGTYATGPLGLDNAKKYRLRIKTADSKIYLSDLTATTYSPPIDSIGFTVTGNQVMIYANTHNPANNTRYYRWDFGETWEFRAAFVSFYETNGSSIVNRPPEHQYPARCWQSDASTDVLLNSTSKLVNDIVYQAPITYISGNSEKISIRYSILLKQYGLSEDAFKFWSQVKKNTEQLGSIFDAQPSQINGNIQCTTNPLEPVFGYISLTNVQTKRIYINRSAFPSSFFVPVVCSTDSIFYVNPKNPLGGPNVATELIPLPGFNKVPLTPFYINNSIPPSGYISTVQACVDCSLRGAKVAPSFWKEQ